tara:strand:- start:186 stop:476 length:291 start_codon:yes stop_codon:yes gene_type:complete
MSFVPCNRHILIEKVEPKPEKKQEACVLVPEDYKIQPIYGSYKVLDFSEDCNVLLQEGDRIVVQNSMVERIDVGGEQHLIVLENHLVGLFYEGADE